MTTNSKADRDRIRQRAAAARGRPKGTGRYSERHVYIIRVLFLYGLSAAGIARLMQNFGVTMSTPQVQGQIAALGYRRSEMPHAVRQRFLDDLKADRIDKTGRFTPIPDYFFRARES